MNLEEHAFKKEGFERLESPREDDIAELPCGNTVKLFDTRREAVELGSRGRYGTGVSDRVAGYSNGNGNLVAYVTDDHAGTVDIGEPEEVHQLPFERVSYGSELDRLDVEDRRNVLSESEEVYENVLETTGIDTDGDVKSSAIGVLSVPTEPGMATSQTYIQRKEGDIEAAVSSGLVEETKVEYPVNHSVGFYHSDTTEKLEEAWNVLEQDYDKNVARPFID